MQGASLAVDDASCGIFDSDGFTQIYKKAIKGGGSDEFIRDIQDPRSGWGNVDAFCILRLSPKSSRDGKVESQPGLGQASGPMVEYDIAPY